MTPARTHVWPDHPGEALELQRAVRGEAERCPPRALPPLDGAAVAGADVAYEKSSARAVAHVAVLRLPGLECVDEAWAEGEARFPYVPGLLAFREGPLLLEAFARLATRPDALLFDAAGRAHPERFGLAAHLGYLFDVPSAGCAKTWLVGEHVAPGPRRGDAEFLFDRGERIGAVLRTREGVRPVFVSAGFALRLEDAVRLVLACSSGYRVPEPLRQADLRGRARLRADARCE